MSLLDGLYSLGKKINKLNGSQLEETQEGIASDILPELELPMPDEEIIEAVKKFKQSWEKSPVRADWIKQCEENEDYWKGKQFGAAEMDQLRPLMDNVIFEALETFLPQATKRNPEPTVDLASVEPESPENLAYADHLKKRLADWADDTKLRLKMKRVARLWAIFMLGVGKIGWDVDNDRPAMAPTRAKKMILDPEGYIDEDGYHGKFIGEPRKMEASILAQLVPSKKSIIAKFVDKKLGTDIQFTEWWTNEYMCWTLGEEVLLKRKNPHWNYETTQTAETNDEYGNPVTNTVELPNVNHFPSPRIPYVFMSIFSLGDKPVEDTNLIAQNLSNQDLINKRLKQIDANADDMNNGVVVSLERAGLTKEQVSTVVEALRNKGVVAIPQGAPKEAIDRFQGTPLPTDVFTQLVDTRSRLRDTFGTRGSTPAGIENEDTVRGKIITRGLDTDRIGGGVTEYLEQFADDVFNWVVQMFYVYDEEFVGQPKPKVIVSVKEGSLLPKDSTTQANQAIELAQAGKMALIDLYRKLEDPNPEEKAANVWLEVNAPQVLYKNNPLVQEAMQMMAQQQQAQAEQEAVKAEQQHSMNMEGKQMDNEAKMQIQQNDLLSRVPTSQ
jgi:hypothetical protein